MSAMQVIWTHNSYRAIIARCCYPGHKHFDYYGGRGITICQRWRDSFDDFVADVGLKPSEHHTLDRHPDTQGNYEPGNVRWATHAEQARNKSNNIWLTYKGEKLILKDLCDKYGLDYCTAWNRVQRGLTPEQIFETPPGAVSANDKLIEYEGITKRQIDHARDHGIDHKLVSQRLINGWDVERALTEPPEEDILITYNGETDRLGALARKYGVSPRTANERYHRGLPPQQIFTNKPYQHHPNHKLVEWKGEQRYLHELAKEHGVKPSTVAERLRNGYDLEKALLKPPREGDFTKKK